MVITNSTTDTVIGELPSEWKVDILGNHYEIQQGKALSKKHREGKSPSLFLRTSNVLWGKLDLSTLDQMDFKDKEREKLRLEKGDLLICEGGDIGRTAIWNGEVSDCYYQNHVFRVRAIDDKIYSPFHMYWMDAAINLLGHYRGYGNRTTIPNLSKTRLSSFPIPLPPLPEQHAIAHVLTTVRQAIEATERVIAAAQELKRSMMKHLFTYGPVPVYEADQVPLKETEIGDVPERWESGKLGNLADIEYGIQAAVANNDDPSIGIPILTNKNISLNGTIDLSSLSYYNLTEGEENKLLEKGDVLLNWRSGSQRHVGKSVLFNLDGDFVCSSFILRIRVYEEIESKFLANILYKMWSQGFFIQKRSQSSVNSVFNKSATEQVSIVYPTKEKQDTINCYLSAINYKIKVETDKKNALDALFKSLLQNLLTGKLRVGIEHDEQSH